MEIELKEAAHGPVYAQVREQIESQIRSGKLASGSALPSPVVLAKTLTVDRGEVQRAYFELEHSGLVKRHKGKDFLGQPQVTYQVA
jgi:DNA-binding transcriptional regulator YhcF (GntR family)